MEVKIESIERIHRTSKKTGKPFTSVVITTDKYEGKKLSGFANVENADWEVGSVVNIEVEQKGDYLNIKSPPRDQGPAARDAGLAEIKNIFTLQLKPMLDAIHKEQVIISERLDKALGESEPPFEEPTF